MTNVIRFPRHYTEGELALEWATSRLYGHRGIVIDFAPYLERKRQVERNIAAAKGRTSVLDTAGIAVTVK